MPAPVLPDDDGSTGAEEVVLCRDGVLLCCDTVLRDTTRVTESVQWVLEVR